MPVLLRRSRHIHLRVTGPVTKSSRLCYRSNRERHTEYNYRIQNTEYEYSHRDIIATTPPFLVALLGLSSPTDTPTKGCDFNSLEPMWYSPPQLFLSAVFRPFTRKFDGPFVFVFECSPCSPIHCPSVLSNLTIGLFLQFVFAHFQTGRQILLPELC